MLCNLKAYRRPGRGRTARTISRSGNQDPRHSSPTSFRSFFNTSSISPNVWYRSLLPARVPQEMVQSIPGLPVILRSTCTSSITGRAPAPLPVSLVSYLAVFGLPCYLSLADLLRNPFSVPRARRGKRYAASVGSISIPSSVICTWSWQ